MEIRGVSFNLRLDTPVDQEHRYLYRKEHLFQYLKQQSVDVFCFQEVLPFMQNDIEAGLTGYTVLGNPRHTNQESTPIAFSNSRFDLLEHQTIWLSDTPMKYSVLPGSAHPRIATIVFLQERFTKQSFLLINTHLDYKQEAVITLQMVCLLDYLKSRNWMNQPLLLAGDFNQLPHQSVHHVLKQHHFQHIYEAGCPMKKTFHGYQPLFEGEPIDYWYFSSHFQYQAAWIDTYQPQAGFLSDHYPVFANFILPSTDS